VFDTPKDWVRRGWTRRVASIGGKRRGQLSALSPGDGDLRALGVLDPRQESVPACAGEIARWRDGNGCCRWYAAVPAPLFRRGGAFAVAGLHFAADQTGRAIAASDRRPLATRRSGRTCADLGSITAYKQKDYPRAIDASRPSAAENQYNLGNALAKTKRYETPSPP
jgi:hypothetical protein